MKRVLLGALAGGVVLHVWSMLAWMVLPMHDHTLVPLKAEAKVTAALQEQGLEAGCYYVPWMPSSADNPPPADMEAATKTFEEKHRAGPVYSIFYHPTGGEVMSLSTIGTGFAIDLLLSLLLSVVLWMARDSVPDLLSRIQIVALIAVFAGVASYGQAWNWMGFTDRFVRDMLIDVFVGWMIAGTVVALIVKRPPVTP